MKSKRSQHVQGMRALKVIGGNFAFNYPPQRIKLEAKRPDGPKDVADFMATRMKMRLNDHA